jgi:hypothetical protein
MPRFFKRVLLGFLFGLLVGLNLNHNLDNNLISVVTSLGGGGNQKYPGNLDKNFHRILQKGFPDSKRRVEFEESQRKFYNSARSKLYETPTLTMQDKKKLLSPEEEDAINYFTGQLFYRSQQDFRTKPNMFGSEIFSI